MDFHCSYEWLKEFVDIRLPSKELAERLSLHAVSVERMRRMDAGLDPAVVVARVEKIEAHSNADKLRVVVVSITPSHSPSRGGGEKKVVCGGTNLREGMLVAFAPVGAKVRWHGEGELVELKPAEIRGARSEGMICAASEIGLGEYFPQEGEREILDLSFIEDRRGWALSPPAGRATTKGRPYVGQPIGKVFGLDDVVLDCEITTNRPDLMSMMGLAREVAAITGARMRPISPPPPGRGRSRGGGTVGRTDSKGDTHTVGAPSGSLSVRVEDPKRCPLYTATLLDGVKVMPSPWWMQRRLLAGGIRPINNVVDVTNYVLLEMGQPLHVFDAQRIAMAQSKTSISIIVRNAKAGETIAALDGETYALTPEHLVIADSDTPIAIAGVIGGSESAVGPQTQIVVLEAATFDPATVRKAWRSLDIRTQSAIQYEKGVQPESVVDARGRAVTLLTEIAGAYVVGKPVIVGRMPKASTPIAFDVAAAHGAIGVAVPLATVKRSLMALGCVVRSSPSSRGGARGGDVWRVTPPWWRRGDLEAAHDLTEEIARLHGYHNLPSVLPTGALPASAYPAKPPLTPFDWEDRCRDALADIGATEVFPFSLTSREYIERCGFTTDQCIVLDNPLSEELALLRPSLLPTLLPIIAQNQGEVPSAVVFELGNVYVPQPQTVGVRPHAKQKHRAGLPREELHLVLAAYGRLMGGGHVEKAKGMVEHCFAMLGIRDAAFRPSAQGALPASGSPPLQEGELEGVYPACLWHPGRTMDVMIGTERVGVIGEVHPLVVERFGIEQRVAVADVDWDALRPHMRAMRAPTSSPAHPAVKRDLAIVVDRTTPYADVAAVLDAAGPLLVAYDLFDTYEDATGTSIPLGKKSIAFHLAYRAADRTLTADEAAVVHARIAAALTTRFGATVRE